MAFFGTRDSGSSLNGTLAGRIASMEGPLNGSSGAGRGCLAAWQKDHTLGH
jgi:hypothetical protein